MANKITYTYLASYSGEISVKALSYASIIVLHGHSLYVYMYNKLTISEKIIILIAVLKV